MAGPDNLCACPRSGRSNSAVGRMLACSVLLGMAIPGVRAGGDGGGDVVPDHSNLVHVPVPLREVAFPFRQPGVRIAANFPAGRTPPLLPVIVSAEEPEPTPTPEPVVEPTPTPTPEPSTTMQFENPLIEAVKFFSEAATRADEDPETGVGFDPTFQPAVPEPPPVSSATYRVE